MTKKLCRVPRGKIVAGVCVGLGEYFDIDPVLIRALFVVAAFSGGVGVLTYVALWVIMPEESRVSSPSSAAQQSGSELDEGVVAEKRKSSVVVGLALVSVGFFFLIRQLVPALDFKFVLPIALIAVGAFIVIRAFRNNQASKNQ